MQTTKTSHFTCQQNLSSVYFSRAKFQLVSYNFSFAMIWQITYTHKLPKPCSATLSHVEFSCTVEGPFSWLIFTHLAPLMKQINRLRSHLLSYVDLLTFKRSQIFGLSSMICRAAWHLGKIWPLIYGCYENSDLENTDLRPPKNSDPWVSRKFRPPEKLRPLGVSKTQTLRKTQTPGCLEKSLGRPPRNTQTPGCLENSDPQYFSNITTNYSHRAASLSFATTEANGFAEISPERKFALAKSRQNQIFDLAQWSFVPTGERFDCSRGDHILDKKGYFGTQVITPQTNNRDSHKLLFLFPVLPVLSARTLVIQDKGSISWRKVIL